MKKQHFKTKDNNGIMAVGLELVAVLLNPLKPLKSSVLLSNPQVAGRYCGLGDDLIPAAVPILLIFMEAV